MVDPPRPTAAGGGGSLQARRERPTREHTRTQTRISPRIRPRFRLFSRFPTAPLVIFQPNRNRIVIAFAIVNGTGFGWGIALPPVAVRNATISCRGLPMGHDTAESRPGEAAPRILRVKVKEPQTVLFLDRAFGHYEHWVGHQNTYPCSGDGCQGCKRGSRIDFYAYVSAHVWDDGFRRWFPCVVQLTASAEQELSGVDLRGSIWELVRTPGRGKMGKLVPWFLERRAPELVPEKFDILPSLRRLFGPRDLRLGVKNNLEPVPKVTEYQGSAPSNKESKESSRVFNPGERKTASQMFQEKKQKGEC